MMVRTLLTTSGVRWLARAGWATALGVLLTACTGRGGGWLPPAQPVFSDRADLGFTFSCQDPSPLVGPTGRLQIELHYGDQGSNPLGRPFAIHGVADTLDPLLESMICIGQNPPDLDPSALVFLGTYRTTSPPPPGFPLGCATTTPGTTTGPCRFEVQVKDNDRDGTPSTGDYFSIQLSTSTDVTSTLAPDTVFYTRSGLLGGGNITVR